MSACVRAATGIALAALLGVPTGAAASSGGWAKISRDALSATSQPSAVSSGSTAIVAWWYRTPANTDSIETTTFTPTLTRTVTGQTTTPVVEGWALTTPDPVLMTGPGGVVEVAFGGTHLPGQADALNGILLATRGPAGAWSSPVVAVGASGGRSGGYGLAALLLGDGSRLLSGDCCGGSSPVYRGVNPDATGVEAKDVGGTSTNRTLAADGAGNVWLAWYDLGSGFHLRQIDPASGAPVAPSVAVPDSQQIANVDARAQLTCNPTASGCRIVYLSGDGKRVESYAPGEARPVVVANAPPQGGLDSVAAAYGPDGRLWVAWLSRPAVAAPTVTVTRGDATGAGGLPFEIGQPAGTVSLFQLALQPMGQNVLVVANAATSPTVPGAMWANLVGVSPQADASGPADVELQPAPHRRFRIQVQFRVPACGARCSARAEIRVRTAACDARCLASVRGTRIPGDARLVLGRRGRVRLPGGRKVRFYLDVDRSALLRAPFHTERGYRVGNTRLRVWIRTAAGEQLAVRDGHIKVSIARIRSGALPGLKGIL